MAHYTLDCVEARERPIDPRDAEIARLAEENRVLVAYIELIDPKRDWRIEEIEKMRNEPEVREGRLAIQPILARHREEASR